ENAKTYGDLLSKEAQKRLDEELYKINPKRKRGKEEIDKENKKSIEDEKKRDAQKFADLARISNNFYNEEQKKRERNIDNQIAASQRRQDELRALAISGDKNAAASIAAEDKRQ